MGGGTFVSAIDMASLFALVMVMAAEVLATLMGLWLLFRTTQAYHAAKGPGLSRRRGMPPIGWHPQPDARHARPTPRHGPG